MTENSIKGREVDVNVVTLDTPADGTSVDPLPVPTMKKIVLLTNPSSSQLRSLEFNVSQYTTSLQTAFLGRTLIYTPVIGSTQTAFAGNMPFCTALRTDMGVVCLASQQTQGKGIIIRIYIHVHTLTGCV